MKRNVTPAAGLAAVLAAAGSVSASNPVCPSNSPLSCTNTTAISNTCCTEVYGQVLQVQFWDTNEGPSDSFTIHGLWPDDCDGSYPQNCDSSRAYTDIGTILQDGGCQGQETLAFMNDYWLNDDGTNEEFWEHEWSKHGTCYSTLQTDCFPDYKQYEDVVDFFSQTVNLFKTLPTYEWLEEAGITPGSGSVSTSKVAAALAAKHGADVTLTCTSGALNQVEYTFAVRGSVADGTFVAAAPIGQTGNCGSTLTYPAKTGGSSRRTKRSIAEKAFAKRASSCSASSPTSTAAGGGGGNPTTTSPGGGGGSPATSEPSEPTSTNEGGGGGGSPTATEEPQPTATDDESGNW